MTEFYETVIQKPNGMYNANDLWHHVVNTLGLSDYKKERVLWCESGSRIIVRTPHDASVGWLASSKVDLDKWLKNGDVCKIMFKANPTKKKMDLETKKSYRVDLVSDSSISEWINRQLENMGCECLNHLSLLKDETKVYRRRCSFNVNYIFSTMLVKIKDVEKFNKALLNGIGKSKCFGHGMIGCQKFVLENENN